MEKQKLDSIQMFRCFAALFVVVFHFREVLPFSYDSFIGHFIIRGYSGVDMFFVISGFIAHHMIQKSKNPKIQKSKNPKMKKIKPDFAIFLNV